MVVLEQFVELKDDIIRMLGREPDLTERTPIWDTETNFGEERPGYPTRTYSGAKAAALVAQAYLDSFRYGVQRTYWYSWDTRFLGIDLTDTRGRATTAAHGLSRLRTWLVGYRWNGCATKRGVTRCRVPSTTGAKRTVVFARSTTTKLRMPTGATSVCSLNGRCRTVKAGKRKTGPVPLSRVAGCRGGCPASSTCPHCRLRSWT